MGAEKGDDEDLVFQAEPGQLGQGKLAFDGDLLLRKPDALDHQRTALGHAQQFLPVGCGFGVWRHLQIVSFLKYMENNNKYY